MTKIALYLLNCTMLKLDAAKAVEILVVLSNKCPIQLLEKCNYVHTKGFISFRRALFLLLFWCENHVKLLMLSW